MEYWRKQMMLHKILKLFKKSGPLSDQRPDLNNLDMPLYFVHIPKTAGTSFINYLAQHMPSRESVAPPFYGDIKGIPFHDSKVKLFHGHIEFCMAPTELPLRMITFLREPISRCISQYKSWNKFANLTDAWIKTMSQEAIEAVQISQKCSLSEFVLTRNPYIDAHISNLQTRFLATTINNSYRYETAAFNVATKFMFVGIVEHFEASITRFRSLFQNSRPYDLPLEQENRSPQKDLFLSPKALDRLHELNSMDIQLYEQELRKFIGYIPRSRAA